MSENYKKTFYQLPTHTVTLVGRYQFAALSKAKFRFINSRITPTMFHLSVMISVLAEEKTFLIRHLESIDGFAVSLSAFAVLGLINTLGLMEFCLHVDEPSFKHMRNVPRLLKLNFTLAVGFLRFYSEHALPNVRSTNSLNVPEDSTETKNSHLFTTKT